MLMATVTVVYSDDQIITDDEGNITMIVRDNGDIVQYTYDNNGNRIVNNNLDEKLEFDSNGNTYSK